MASILQTAAQAADAASVLHVTTRSKSVTLFNGGMVESIHRDHDELALRVIHNGRIGRAVGSATIPADELVPAAVRSAKDGARAGFDFPAPGGEGGGGGQIFDPAVAEITLEQLGDDARFLADGLAARDPELMAKVHVESAVREVHIENSSGLDRSYRQTLHTAWVMHMFEGSKEGLNRGGDSCRYFRLGDADLDRLVRDRRALIDHAQPRTGRLPVLFMPSASWSLLFRIAAGISGQAVVQGITPLKDKLGQAITGSALSVWDDPTMDWAPGAVPFDDEGTPARKRPLVEAGVLRGFVFDLMWGHKDGRGSSGNGYHKTTWTRQIEDPMGPHLSNLVVPAGETPVSEMIAGMDHGVIVDDVIGFHSGNMLAGEYSMGVGTGSVVEHGKVVGRCVDTMVAGNIYQDFGRIAALGNKLELNMLGWSPAILLDGVHVSAG